MSEGELRLDRFGAVPPYALLYHIPRKGSAWPFACVCYFVIQLQYANIFTISNKQHFCAYNGNLDVQRLHIFPPDILTIVQPRRETDIVRHDDFTSILVRSTTPYLFDMKDLSPHNPATLSLSES